MQTYQDADPIPEWIRSHSLDLPRPSMGIGSNEDEVMPHRLCQLCMRVVAEYTRDELWQSDALGSLLSEDVILEQNSETHTLNFEVVLPERRDFGGRKIAHYKSIEALWGSANDGCHICSILASQQDVSVDLELQVTPDKRQDYDGWQEARLVLESMAGEHRGSMTLARSSLATVYTEQTPGPSSGSLYHRYRWMKSTSCPMAFDMINDWIQNCRQSHSTCGQRLGPEKPTRILDLSAFNDSKDLRLVMTDNIREDFEYATLSYRWTRSNPLVLTTANQGALTSQISLSALSQTIQEAIEVCRRLCMRYLWVDALCIVQEGGQDFAKEVSKMDAMYAGSLFTIAAADSSEDNPGCFRACHPLSRENCDVIDPNGFAWEVQPDFYDFAKCQHIFDLESSILCDRGWVFQERVMSPRTIHFTARGIILECRKQTVCPSCSGWGKEIDEHLSHYSPNKEFEWKKAFSHLQQEWADSVREIHLRAIWVNLASAYDKTELTIEDDRLSALAGLARVIQTKSTHAASYGLWLEFFLHELQWFVPCLQLHFNTRGSQWEIIDAETPYSDNLPSWSWLRVTGKYLTRTYNGKAGKLCAEITELPPATPFAQLSSLSLQNSLSASFKIRGQVTSFTAVLAPWCFEPWTLMYASHPLDAALTAWSDSAWARLHTNGTVNFCLPKEEFRSWPRYCPDRRPIRGQVLQCMLLECETDRDLVLYTGLVLEVVDEARKRFRRVGYFKQSIQEGAIRIIPRLLEDRAASRPTTSSEAPTFMLDDPKSTFNQPAHIMFPHIDDVEMMEIEIE